MTQELVKPPSLDGAGTPTAGARWLRCDLHVHTPLDPSRSFGEDLVTAVRESGEGDQSRLREIAFKLFDACRAAELDLVAFTDHNNVEGYRTLSPFLDQWQNERRAALTVLPGVEITVGAERGLHLLLVADAPSPDWLDEYLSYIFGAGDRFTTDGQRQPRSCGRTLADFVSTTRECFEQKGLAYLLIPAHINRGSGVDSELRRTVSDWERELQGLLRKQAFAQAGWAGFQVRGQWQGIPRIQKLLQQWAAAFTYGKPFDRLDASAKARLAEREHWPVLEASDPHGYEQVGAQYTYLKMDSPSLEGIRLALLDPQSRLRSMADGPPTAGHPQLRRVKVTGTDFFENVAVPLHPNFNCLIGGRGVGKSALLELLRYGLDRARPEDFADEEEEIRDRVERLLRRKSTRDHGQTPGMLLPEHRVEVEVVVSGRLYRVIRDGDGIRVSSAGSAEDASDLDVRALIVPRVLSQRQIAGIGRDPAAQRRELDALGPADERDAHRRARHGLIEQLTALQARRREMHDRLRSLGEKETQLRQVSDQIDLLEQEGNRALLDRYRQYQDERRWLDETTALLKQAEAGVNRLREELADNEPTPPPDGPSHDLTAGIADRVEAELRTATGSLEEIRARLQAARTAIGQDRAERWEPGLAETERQYGEAQERLEAGGTSFGEHRRLLQRRQLLEREVAALRRLPDEITQLDADLQALRAKLVEWHRVRADRRQATAASLEQQGADLRMVVETFGDGEDLATRRGEWFAGTGLQERDWDLLVDYVYTDASEVPRRLGDVVAALRRDAARAVGTGTEPREGWDTARLIGTTLTGHFPRAVERLDAARLDEMERFLPDDRVETLVRDTAGAFKPISQGSLGQRSTAVLSLLLAATQGPLVIDQPEDDLDNQYIYDVVVDLLRKRKFSRQLILATHNANVPVNGDAELIIALDVEERLGVVKLAGSIDRAPVKEEVSRVMEGSVEAFRLRRQRYGF